jgi:predicted porin
VGFRSADFSGFALQAAVSAGEGTRTVPANKRTVGINAKYAAGPLFVGLAYDGANGDNNVVVGGASWDFGVVKPMLSYAQTEALETTGSTAGNKLKDKTWAVGATAPIGAGRLKAVYARVKRDNNLAGLSDWHLNRVGLGYEYSLSKRTSLYADVGSAKQSHANTLAGAEPTRTTGFDAGIKHSF